MGLPLLREGGDLIGGQGTIMNAHLVDYARHAKLECVDGYVASRLRVNLQAAGGVGRFPYAVYVECYVGDISAVGKGCRAHNVGAVDLHLQTRLHNYRPSSARVEQAPLHDYSGRCHLDPRSTRPRFGTQDTLVCAYISQLVRDSRETLGQVDDSVSSGFRTEFER